MLSVNYISSYLDKNQKNIDNKEYILKDFEINNEKKDFIKDKINILKNEEKKAYNDLYDCFDTFFEKEFFGLNKEVNKNKKKIFTFFSCIFGIGDENYYLFKDDEKIKCIKNLIHRMDNDIFSKNYYNIFRYDKNKYFSKEKISTILKESFNLRVNENFNILIKYLVFYLNINLIIFEVKNQKILNKYKIFSNKLTEEENKYLPYYFIIKEDDNFIPIMIKNKFYKNYIEYTDNYKIINKLSEINNNEFDNIENNKNDTKNFKKMKIEELRNYCIENNINIYKTSEKTGKQINKLKDELLKEII